VTLAVATIITAIILARRGASRAAGLRCRNNLRQIGLALQNYHDTYSAFPAARDAGHSWRIRVLPFMLSSPQYSVYDFDQPWNAENNITIDTRPLPSKSGEFVVFGNPYGPACDGDDPHVTSYLAIVGDDAFAHPNQTRTQADISDGLENTIAAVEVGRSDVHWLSPVDLEFDKMSFAINDGPQSISSLHPSGPLVLFCDGAVFRVNPAIDPELVRGMCTIRGGEQISRDSLTAKGLLVP
jgi:hypothetical protein